MPVLRLLLNCPDRDCARAIASALLDARLVASANLHPEIESHYVWDGARVSAPETPLVLVAPPRHLTAIEALVAALHPYDAPPLIAQELVWTTDAVARWVEDVTKAP